MLGLAVCVVHSSGRQNHQVWYFKLLDATATKMGFISSPLNVGQPLVTFFWRTQCRGSDTEWLLTLGQKRQSSFWWALALLGSWSLHGRSLAIWSLPCWRGHTERPQRAGETCPRRPYCPPPTESFQHQSPDVRAWVSEWASWWVSLGWFQPPAFELPLLRPCGAWPLNHPSWHSFAESRLWIQICGQNECCCFKPLGFQVCYVDKVTGIPT
jgi:hypothetical protein